MISEWDLAIFSFMVSSWSRILWLDAMMVVVKVDKICVNMSALIPIVLSGLGGSGMSPRVLVL